MRLAHTPVVLMSLLSTFVSFPGSRPPPRPQAQGQLNREDVVSEIAAIAKRRAVKTAQIEKVVKRTSAPGYLKVPPRVQAADTETLAKLTAQLCDLEQATADNERILAVL